MSSLKSVIAILLVAGICIVGCTSNKTSAEKTANATDQNTPVKASKLEKDLICEMGVDPGAPGTLKTEYKGKTYYFCSALCKKTFEADPEQYVKAAGASDAHEMNMQK